MLRPRRSATRSRSTPTSLVLEMVLTDSIAAQRTRREPCLVIRPRRTWVSDSWCLGVRPAQQVSFDAEANRVMSPISATRTAARGGANAGDLLHRGISRLLRQPSADDAGERGDLEVDVVHHPAQ